MKSKAQRKLFVKTLQPHKAVGGGSVLQSDAEQTPLKQQHLRRLHPASHSALSQSSEVQMYKKKQQSKAQSLGNAHETVDDKHPYPMGVMSSSSRKDQIKKEESPGQDSGVRSKCGARPPTTDSNSKASRVQTAMYSLPASSVSGGKTCHEEDPSDWDKVALVEDQDLTKAVERGSWKLDTTTTAFGTT